MNKLKFLVCAAGILLFLTSCAPLGALSSSLGLDADDYSVEEVRTVLTEESEKWGELSDMLSVLTLDSTEIAEFDSMKTSSETCRDSLLNYMYGHNYEKYAGNTALIDKLSEKYPEYTIIAAIPQGDFEAEMYRCFGGSVKITHRSGELFRYLEGGSVYLPVTAPIDGGIDIKLTKAAETEHTYRLSFTVSGRDTSADYHYRAIVIKREDGTMYFKSVYKS